MNIELPQIDRSAISWCGPTWNPWQGCIKVSAGCKYCYMYRDKKRYGQDPSTVVRSAAATFYKPLKWQKEVERGIRTDHDRLVFTCSWSDWFIEEADDWRPEAWDIVRATPGLIYQILTKRPERIAAHLPSYWDEIRDRIWLGTSIEDQAALNLRGPVMRYFAERGDFVWFSIEPLLEAIHFPPFMFFDDECPASCWLDWAVVGGESGGEYRDPGIAALEGAAKLCGACGVPIWVKQDCGAKPGLQGRLSDAIWALKEMPSLCAPTAGAAKGTT